MTVKELIDTLSKFPEDYNIRICSTDSKYYEHIPQAGFLEEIEKVDIHNGYNFSEVIITNGDMFH